MSIHKSSFKRIPNSTLPVYEKYPDLSKPPKFDEKHSPYVNVEHNGKHLYNVVCQLLTITYYRPLLYQLSTRIYGVDLRM